MFNFILFAENSVEHSKINLLGFEDTQYESKNQLELTIDLLQLELIIEKWIIIWHFEQILQRVCGIWALFVEKFSDF